MPTDNRRMLIEIETARRAINRRIINPALPELTLADLHPVISLAAKARADYLVTLFDIARKSGDALPPDKEIARLAAARQRYEELVQATQALETAIEREYIEVVSRAYSRAPS